MRRTHRALALAATGLLLTVATACGDESDGGSGGGSGSGGGAGPEGLELVPADATAVEVVDRAAAAERIGADAETGDSADDIGDYAQQMVEKAPWGGTELDQWVVPMNEGDAAFTALDVERQVTFSVDGGALTKVWQVDDDLDLDDVATDLEGSGFEAEEAGGATTFTADLGLADPTTQLVDGKYPVVSFREVTVVPDEHLRRRRARRRGARRARRGPGVAGRRRQRRRGHRVARGRGAPVADHGRRGPRALRRRCGRPISTDSGLDALETPEQVAFAITGEGSVAASVTDTFAFADAETAEADAEARQTYLDEGTSLKTREPIADLLDGVEVSTSGPVETVDYSFSDGAGRALLMQRSQDVVSACNPG